MIVFQLLFNNCFSPSEDISQIFEEFLDAPHKRVKRREKTLTGVICSLIKMKNYFINMTVIMSETNSYMFLFIDGCSSHMTGVAVSTLGGFLNYYLSEQDITKRPLI